VLTLDSLFSYRYSVTSGELIRHERYLRIRPSGSIGATIQQAYRPPPPPPLQQQLGEEGGGSGGTGGPQQQQQPEEPDVVYRVLVLIPEQKGYVVCIKAPNRVKGAAFVAAVEQQVLEPQEEQRRRLEEEERWEDLEDIELTFPVPEQLVLLHAQMKSYDHADAAPGGGKRVRKRWDDTRGKQLVVEAVGDDKPLLPWRKFDEGDKHMLLLLLLPKKVRRAAMDGLGRCG